MREIFEVSSWQEFEELARDILELHGFSVEFRKVFRNIERKFEIDVLAENDYSYIAVDCKIYGLSRHRRSQLIS